MIGGITGCGTARKTVPQQEPEQVPEKTPPPIPEAENTPEPPPPSIIDPDNIPETPREMRGAWVASVANIDWPSEPGLPVAQQKAELRALLDRAAQLNMNAIFLQVRPAADALYDSPYEPWSEFLTGKQGRAPVPFYDPLEFAIEEAHLRGLELHAWFNPFRAYHHSEKTGFAPSHINNIHPELVVKYGRYFWLDPGFPEARAYSREVILDVARRYDIDGIHLDDYFYPYPEVNRNGNDIPFPDDQSYRKYLSTHRPVPRNDWRRQNINQFVQTLQQELRKVKPNILFGISPFGIWRPGNPPSIQGFDAYDRIYADAKKWLRNGWVDYLSPQLYWPISEPRQSFPVLLQWWQQQNTYGKHLWPGLYTSQVGKSWDANEITRQIGRTRQQAGTSGHIHFSMQALMNNSGNVAWQLLNQKYAQPALVPASPWLSNNSPPQPNATLERIENQLVITFPPSELQEPWRLIIKTKYGDHWNIDIQPGWKDVIILPAENKNGAFKGAVVSMVNRQNIESAGQIFLPVINQTATAE